MELEPTLTFASFRTANVSRCEKWHPDGIGSWSPSDWLTAAMGELGELASEVKMHNRVRDGLAGNKEQVTTEERARRMANEAADVVTYIDLFCAERGIDLGAALVRKFNEVSRRVGFPDRLALTSPAQCIDLLRLVPPEWLSEQIGGHFDDLTPGQAWRQGFNQCRARALLLVEQAMGFPSGGLPAQGIDQGQFTDADVRAWVERNDLGGSFGNFTDARCAFDDARSAHLIDGQRDAAPGVWS